MSSMLVTVGLALDIAHDRGLRVDVETTTGRVLSGVEVGAVDRFCVILLDGGKAHVVAREHLVAVSMDQDCLLQLTGDSDYVAAAERAAAG